MEITFEELLFAIQNTPRISKFFTNFFPVRKANQSKTLEIQVKKGKKKMAPFVAEQVGGKVMVREGFNTQTLTPPTIAPSRILTTEDINNRGFGESLYDPKTPEERAEELLAEDANYLEDSISNRLEWMCRNIFLGKTITVKDEEAGVDFNINFQFTNKETLLGGTKWSAETSDPLGDLKRWKKFALRKSGITPEVCVMGESAATSFLNHPKVQKMLDNRNITIGNINPMIIDKAATFVGKLEGLEIYTYDEWFVDDDGIEKPMMPINEVIVAPKVYGSIQYGSVTIMDDAGNHKTCVGELVPDIFINRKAKTKELTITSRPLPVPNDVDSIYTAVVVD